MYSSFELSCGRSRTSSLTFREETRKYPRIANESTPKEASIRMGGQLGLSAYNYAPFSYALCVDHPCPIKTLSERP
jgi:hypothetical protein